VRSITLRDVRRKGWKEFAHAKNEEQAILDALKLLDAYGWLRLRERFSGVKGGRPTIEAVVNPKAYEG